jgi:hypothetical protein
MGVAKLSGIRQQGIPLSEAAAAGLTPPTGTGPFPRRAHPDVGKVLDRYYIVYKGMQGTQAHMRVPTMTWPGHLMPTHRSLLMQIASRSSWTTQGAW